MKLAASVALRARRIRHFRCARPQQSRHPRATSGIAWARIASCSIGTRSCPISSAAREVQRPAFASSELGKTTEGRPFIAATIAAPETLRNLDRYREIQTRLADPRRTAEAEAEKLIAEGQDGSADHLLDPRDRSRLTHRPPSSSPTAADRRQAQVPERSSKTRSFFLVPSLNPDGVDIVTRLVPEDARHAVRRHVAARAVPEVRRPRQQPRLVHLLAGETRLAISKLHNVWHPQIVYDVHQQGANASRMFVPPWLDPIEPNVDPIIVQLCNTIGRAWRPI